SNTIIGRTEWVKDIDGKCKGIREAESLKGYFSIRYLKNDGIHDFEIVDFNYTSIELKVFVRDSKELNKDIPIKVDGIQKKTKRLTSLSDKPTIIFKSDNILASNYSFGSESTTIMLQDPDTETLDDDDPFESGDSTTWTIYGSLNPTRTPSGIKFNISEIPAGNQIDAATLYLLVSSGNGLPLTVQVFEYDIVWNEEDGIDESTTGGALLDTDADSGVDDLINLDVTSWVSSGYTSGDINVSFALNITGTFQSVTVISKEFSTASSRPFLNITFSIIPVIGITTSLTSPGDASVEPDGDITFNCSAVPVLSNVTNITLYHNSSGSFDKIH
ncbi:hypothetical protein LCGC14_3161290, partial [marine sediment metagenome]